MALATAWVPPKAIGTVAGTPPIGGSGPSSHTARLPLPSARETIICRSGRTFGSLREEEKVVVPTARPLMPGLASM